MQKTSITTSMKREKPGADVMILLLLMTSLSSVESGHWLLELMLDRRLRQRETTTWYGDSSDLLMFSVDQLTTVQFEVMSCSGLHLALLATPYNFSHFIDIAVGTAGNRRTDIRICSTTPNSCVTQRFVNHRPLKCFQYVTFAVVIGSSTLSVGILPPRSRPPHFLVFARWTPAANSSLLRCVRYFAVNNERDQLNFALYRNLRVNPCYVNETIALNRFSHTELTTSVAFEQSHLDRKTLLPEQEASERTASRWKSITVESMELVQCSDNLITRSECIGCGCCWNEHRLPACYRSYATGEIHNISKMPSVCGRRSIQDIITPLVLLVRSPVYVSEPVDILVLTRSFWNGLDYRITYLQDEQPLKVENVTTINATSLPGWIKEGRFVSSTDFRVDTWQSGAVDPVVSVALTHVYSSEGPCLVRLTVGGKLTLRGPVQTAEVAVNVSVFRRPSLADVIGHVTLAGQSQTAYVDEAATFVYAVEHSVENVSYYVNFGDGDLLTTEIKLSHDAAIWNSTFCSGNTSVTARQVNCAWPSSVLRHPVGGLATFRHVFATAGHFWVTADAHRGSSGTEKLDVVSANIPVVVSVRRSLTEETGPVILLVCGSTFVNEPANFVILMQNSVPDVEVTINCEDRSGKLSINVVKSDAEVKLSELTTSARCRIVAIPTSEAELAKLTFSRLDAAHSFDHVGEHRVTVSMHRGLQELGTLSAMIAIHRRPTLAEEVGLLVLIPHVPSYVNETTEFVYGVQRPHTTLDHRLDYGDGSPPSVAHVNYSSRVPAWLNVSSLESVFEYLGWVGTAKHVYHATGMWQATFSVHGRLNSVGKCDFHAVGTTIVMYNRSHKPEPAGRERKYIILTQSGTSSVNCIDSMWPIFWPLMIACFVDFDVISLV